MLQSAWGRFTFLRTSLGLVVVAAAGLLPSSVSAQFYNFCHDGINTVEFIDDGGNASVDVMVVQAPLFSTNPKVGQKLKHLKMFHTALVFAQTLEDERRHWTLEFDFIAGSIFNGIAPVIANGTMVWNNDARYCLTRGILWERDHWTQAFDQVHRLTADQARRLFQEFIFPFNSSAPGSFPQYELWRLRTPPSNADGGQLSSDERKIQIHDVTCADGVTWVLHFIEASLGVVRAEKYQLLASTVAVDADALEEVDHTDPNVWADLIRCYENVNDIFHGAGIFRKFWDAHKVLSMQYIYDTNSHKYYRIIGNRFPWFRVEYLPYPVVGPGHRNDVDGEAEVDWPSEGVRSVPGLSPSSQEEAATAMTASILL